MPAARQRSRSPTMALAVRATIGESSSAERFALADNRVVWIPSSSGICRSISAIEVFFGQQVERLEPVAGDAHPMSRLGQNGRRQALVDVVVFDQKDVERARISASHPVPGARKQLSRALPAIKSRTEGTSPAQDAGDPQPAAHAARQIGARWPDRGRCRQTGE